MKFRFLKYFMISMASLVLLIIGTGLAISRIGKVRWKGPTIDGSYVRKVEMPDQPQFASEWQKVLAHPQDWGPLSVDSLIQWDYNPWRQKPVWAGENLMKLRYSKDPADHEKLDAINKLTETWFQRVLTRHPDMAVEYEDVPDAENGLLRMLEFAKQFDDPSSDSNCLRFPPELIAYSKTSGPWNEPAAREWLENEKDLLAEIRAIGLAPEESVKGIPIDQWATMSLELYRACAVALMMDARIAAQDGDITRALESVHAANGLADHLQNIETPTGFNSMMVAPRIRSEVQQRFLSEVIAVIPTKNLDLDAWENAVTPPPASSADFARLLRGEWAAGLQREIIPVLADSEDPKTPPDPEDYIDVVTEAYRRVIDTVEKLPLSEIESATFPPPPSMEELSLESRQFNPGINEFPATLKTLWEAQQISNGLVQAAFALLKDEPGPDDPIYGEPYFWDPATRQLSAPKGEKFASMNLQPIKLPKL